MGMSERMTDERAEIARLALGKAIESLPMKQKVDALWSADAIVGDWLRARASEVAKDAAIKALVKVLEEAGVECGAIADHHKNPVSTTSALFQLAQRIESTLRCAGRK